MSDGVVTGINNVAIGTNALDSVTSGSSNVALGRAAAASLTTGSENVSIGLSVMADTTDNITGNGNVAIGKNCLDNITSGSGNVAIGSEVAKRIKDSNSNVFIGRSVANRQIMSGAFNNVAVGTNSLDNITSGDSNITVGLSAGTNITTGTSNVAVGTSVISNERFTTTGSQNIAFGINSLDRLTSGNNNIAVGTNSLLYCTNAAENIAIGKDSASNIGARATNNIAIGRDLMTSVTSISALSGLYNIAVGTSSMDSLQGGIGEDVTGSAATGLFTANVGTLLNPFANGSRVRFWTLVPGTGSGFSNSTTYYIRQLDNSVPGVAKFKLATTNSDTDIVPIDVNMSGHLYINSSAEHLNSNNLAVGTACFQNARNGRRNIAIGTYCLAESIGEKSFEDNIAIGYSAASSLSGDDNIAIGMNALDGAINVSNTVAIGRDAGRAGSYGGTMGNNLFIIGNTDHTIVRQSGAALTSDARDKTEITNTTLGLDFIENLRPVQYKMNYRSDYTQAIKVPYETGEIDPRTGEPVVRFKTEIIYQPNDGSKTRSRPHQGLIAQEVKQTMNDLEITDFAGYIDMEQAGESLSLRYEEFIAPMIKAIQQLSDRNKALEERIAALEG